MRTPASIAGHPIHPMLVPIAIGGYVLSVVADLICIATGNGNPWNAFAYYAMIGGIIGALAAAVPGFIDYLSLPAGAVKKTAVTHMLLNLTVTGLFIVNAFLRYNDPQNLKIPMILSFVAIVMLVVSGWLGGKLVFEAGVGVDTGAGPR